MRPHDLDCPECGERADVVTCYACGHTARMTNCGHMPQPRPIAAGRMDGSDLAHAFCARCAAMIPPGR